MRPPGQDLTADARSRLKGMLGQSEAEARGQVRARFLEVHGPGELRLVLWGAGPLAATVLAGLDGAGLRPLAVCDRNPARWGEIFGGLTILSPEEAIAQFGDTAVFIPAVYTNRALLEELARRGLRTLPLAVLAWQVPGALLPHCALDLPVLLHQEAGQVEAALGLWADEASRQEYLGQIQWRANLDAALLPAGSPFAEMFNPVDLMDFLPEEHFVDCGAFDGDSIRNFLRHHPGGTGPITAIEPDPLTFQRLLAFQASLEPGQGARIRPLHAALGASRGSISFRATGSVVSGVTQEGGVQVRRERLDDLEAAAGVTFLKMDIEGDEPGALEGARAVLGGTGPSSASVSTTGRTTSGAFPFSSMTSVRTIASSSGATATSAGSRCAMPSRPSG